MRTSGLVRSPPCFAFEIIVKRRNEVYFNLFIAYRGCVWRQRARIASRSVCGYVGCGKATCNDDVAEEAAVEDGAGN